MTTELRAWFTRAAARLAHRNPAWRVAAGDPREPVLAIYPPEYVGVGESTRRAFAAALPVSSLDLLSRTNRDSLVDGILGAAPEVVVFSGFTTGYEDVARSLRARQPSLRILQLWHGTPMQLSDRDERLQFSRVLELASSKVISRVGFFKTGEAESLRRRGIDACDVFNPPPPGSPLVQETRLGDDGETPLRIGIFSAGPSWRKNPYAMLAGVARIPEAEVNGVLDVDAQAYARGLGIRLGRVREQAWSQEELAAFASELTMNLYVGLSECSPLFPLESLHWGVPCLIGPNSHLFAGSPVSYIADDAASKDSVRAAAEVLEELVVGRPDDPVSIADAIVSTRANRSALLRAYRDWVEPYREAAWSSLEQFVGKSLLRSES